MMLAGCSSETEIPEVDTCAPMLTMDTSTEGTTRAYWHDDTPAGGASAVFHWNANENEVHTALYSATADKFITWTNDSTYTRCAVKPWSNDKYATITSVNGVNATDYSNIAKDDKVYFLNGGTLAQTNTGVSATLTLPSTFTQKEASSLEEFRQYTYACASSTVQAVAPNYITVNPARFTPAVACLRIIIENTSKYDYTIKQIKMSTNNNSKVFANQKEWSVTSAGASLTETETNTGYYSTLTSKINYSADDDDTNDGNLVAAGETQAYYMLVFPVTSWLSTTSLLFNIDYSFGSQTITTPQSVLAVSSIPNQKFEAGKIYNLRFKEMVLDVDHVTVDEWTENTVNVGQITVKTPEVTIAPGATANVLLNAGHLNTDDITVTCPTGSKLTATKRVDGDKMYIDIKADSDATPGTYTVEINDIESNSMATIAVTVS